MQGHTRKKIMMSVWCVLPSIRPAAEASRVVDRWRERDYKVAILREGESIPCDLEVRYPYESWARSINMLTALVLSQDMNASWIVAGGDDQDPEMDHSADDIAEYLPSRKLWVMQPTGDRYNYGYIDTSAASPWISSDFCARMYGGRGPLFEGYRWYYSDTELMDVAKLMGCFEQRRDLTQEHHHWTRQEGAECPDHLKPVYEGKAAVVAEDKALYESRKALGFPGYTPLEVRHAGYRRTSGL